MLVVYLLTFLITFACATNKSCSQCDTRLLNYIDWQMKTTKCTQNNKPGKCVCNPKEKQPIAFHAKLEKNLQNLPSQTVVKFTQIITNGGKAYDPATGKFTSPEDGLYSFSWTILTAKGKRFNSEFVVDGTSLAISHNEADKISNYLAASHSAVVKLKMGNKAWIRSYGVHGKYACGHWSSFSGFKI